ncbi:MAG: AMP-binding protein [Actinomycetota bacterium]|nr:AMP-binding protein [Actinomycetota bacterium]
MHDVGMPMIRAWSGHLGIAAEDVDPETLRRDLARGTIPAILARTARDNPGSTLGIDNERITHADLYRQVCRHASVLADAGVTPGSRVVINAPTSMSLVIAYLSTLHLGAVAVLTNPAYTASELDLILERSQPAVLLVHDEFEHTVSVPVERLSALAEATGQASEHDGVELHSGDVALLAFTSGTTGMPKGVPLTHGQLLASIRSAMLAWRWRRDDTLVHALPLFHQHGLSGVHASLLAGSNAVVLSQFDAERLVETIAQEQATVLFAVPSIHQRLVDLDSPRLAPLRDLRLITSGSAPLSAALADAVREKTGSLPLERYGLTETGLDVSNSYDGGRAVGTVGFPLPGVEAALTDPRGDPVTVGEEGEIVLRGPQVFTGYLDDPAATDAAFWPDGWFRTGDLGRWDENGRLVISGRLKDLVITGGMNVSPIEVESVVARFAGIAEAAVSGLPSERWGEEVAVWIVTDAGAAVNTEDLLAHCRVHLAGFKCPKQVFRVSELPRNAMGKITRSTLKAVPGQ